MFMSPHCVSVSPSGYHACPGTTITQRTVDELGSRCGRDGEEASVGDVGVEERAEGEVRQHVTVHQQEALRQVLDQQ